MMLLLWSNNPYMMAEKKVCLEEAWRWYKRKPLISTNKKSCKKSALSFPPTLDDGRCREVDRRLSAIPPGGVWGVVGVRYLR